jgi:hypothetical protein
MSFFILMPPQWIFGIGLVFLVSAITALAFNERQKDAVLGRFRFRRRLTSGASTPPRSLSPVKKSSDGSTDTKESSISTPDYVDVFPPSRRSVLSEMTCSLDRDIRIDTEPSLDLLRNSPLPTTQAYDFQYDAPKYTPTGFSTVEIKAMGDFPEYDILSGVPIPEPYANFDPVKALPRPYRPFRWAYHQTMCKLPLTDFYSWISLIQEQH